MHFTMEVDRDVLRAQLFRRQSAEEMHEFIKALNAEIWKTRCNLALICVRHSRPLFKAEYYAGLTRLANIDGIRIALIGDSEELRASHHYIELLHRQQGANVRGFNDEGSAIQWLKNGEPRKSRPSLDGPERGSNFPGEQL